MQPLWPVILPQVDADNAAERHPWAARVCGKLCISKRVARVCVHRCVSGFWSGHGLQGDRVRDYNKVFNFLFHKASHQLPPKARTHTHSSLPHSHHTTPIVFHSKSKSPDTLPLAVTNKAATSRPTISVLEFKAEQTRRNTRATSPTTCRL